MSTTTFHESHQEKAFLAISEATINKEAEQTVYIDIQSSCNICCLKSAANMFSQDMAVVKKSVHTKKMYTFRMSVQ